MEKKDWPKVIGGILLIVWVLGAIISNFTSSEDHYATRRNMIYRLETQEMNDAAARNDWETADSWRRMRERDYNAK